MVKNQYFLESKVEPGFFRQKEQDSIAKYAVGDDEKFWV
jgi:hypothetical protein